MRRFALSTLFGIALLNCFLAYSGHYLSSQVRQFIADHHTKPSTFSLIALAIPPWFYLIAAVAVVAALLGLTRRLGDGGIIYTIVGLMLLDIVALLVSLWGVGVFLFPFYERVAEPDHCSQRRESVRVCREVAGLPESPGRRG